MSTSKDISDYEKLAFQWEHAEYFPRETQYSLPLITKRNDKIYQASFLYENSPDENGQIHRPFAWFLLPIDESVEYSFSWCQTQDFVDTNSYPLSQIVSTNLPVKNLPREDGKSYRQELAAVFQRLLEFPFHHDLSPEQKEIVQRYKDLFLPLAYEGLYPFYQGIAPDFFQWLDLPLLPEWESVISKTEPEDNHSSQLLAKIDDLSSQFKEKIHHDATREKLLDRLHEELQEYKVGEYDKLTRGMERDVILTIDHIHDALAKYESATPSPAGYKKLLEVIKAISQDLTDLLYRQGVDPYEVEEDRVQIPQQKVLETVITTDRALDKHVAEKLTQGWEKAGNIVRAEYVRAYLYEPNAPQKKSKELLEDE